MLSSWPTLVELHREPGEFPAFLRDNIIRVIMIGIKLFQETSVKDVELEM